MANIVFFLKRGMGAVVAIVAILLAPVYLLPRQSASANNSSVHWEQQRAPGTPKNGAIVGGPGDAPEPGSPLFVCRAKFAGGLLPGKWVKGNCNISYGGQEIVRRDYELAYGQAEWRPYAASSGDLIQTGKDQDAFPLYFCRVKYWKQTWGEDYSVHPIALQAPRP